MLNKRILSFLLALVLVIGLVPTAGFATETEGTTETTEASEPAETTTPETSEPAETTTPEPTETSEPAETCAICGVVDCQEHTFDLDGLLDALTGENEGDDETEPTEEETEATEEEPTHIEGCSEECEAEDCECECHPVVEEEDEGEFDAEAAYEYVMSLSSNDEKMEYLDSLSDEEYSALEKYAVEMDPPATPVTKVFTNAGPFKPAVTVEVASSRSTFGWGRMFATGDTAAEPENGLILDKSVKSVAADGSVTLRLEAYVTGQTITSTETKTEPVDIVLVLDQSGSMAYDFNGNSTNTNTSRRQYAMKEAVNNFIASVGEKYNAATADHRMALVTFGSDSDVLQGWTYVDIAGVGTLQGKISGLPNSPSGATNVAAGMQEAETLMGSGYSYSGSNQERQKVVIVFTDGVPTTESDFSVSVANGAISSAKNLKDAGVTVYSVGIFTGADPSQLYGEKVDYTLTQDTICTGEVGSRWGAGHLNSLIGDIREVDIAAGNRFLNYVSSNFEDATEIGIKSFITFTASGWEITKNFDRDSSEYYLTAADSTSLNKIFQTISSNIQTGTASMNLGSSTVLNDVVSDYFTVPNGADSVSVYTSDYNSDGTWDADVAASYTVNVDGNNIDVTGFDYGLNYVDGSDGRAENDTSADGDFYGRKLIVEVVIKPDEDFLGGNGVLTNGSDSGIYSEGELVEAFEQPTTDVKVVTIIPAAQDQSIYLTNVADLQALLNGTDSRISGTNNDYVTVWYEIYDGETLIATYAIYSDDSNPEWIVDENQTVTPALDADKIYTVKCTVHPNNDGTYGDATSNGVPANVYVFKPTVTFQDSAINAGATPDYAKDNFVSVEWTNSNTTTQPTGTAPVLTYTYDPAASALSSETAVTVTAVETTTGTAVDLDNVTFIRKACSDCGFAGGTVDMTAANPVNFIVHINTFDLTIKKTGVTDTGAPFVFNISGEGVNMNVVIYGNDEVTIKGLPAGTYTVKETNGYWRYDITKASPSQSQTVTPTGATATVTFANTRTEDKWLDDFASATNIFG